MSPGDKDNYLFPEMAVWVIGFVLNNGVGMPPSAGIYHMCPEVLDEREHCWFFTCVSELNCLMASFAWAHD